MPNPTRSYNHATSAAALFFKNTVNNNVHQALRVEVPEIGKEFTDSAYIGKDPDGIFYYDAASDMSGSVKAKVLKIVENSKVYVRIKFFTSREDETYAEFIGEDPDDAVDATGMVAYTQYGRDGNWTDLNIGSANATVYKRTRESDIKLTAGAISNKATMTLANNVNVDVDVKGTLYFKKISDLSRGRYASYNNDRIVFYEDDYTGKDFVAYFIPFEGSVQTLGIASTNTVIISGVTWSLV
ncbi:hypothetical protein BJY52DRAFT_1310530 [Lactarius psammicola]|nr:hypothetical protein BJY52DRAFT_1310530 [Lactarius psammicola]